MAQHDFTPAWLNFPTAPSSAKPSQVCDKSFQSPAKCLDNHGDVSRRRHNSSDDSEPVNGRTGGIFSRKEGNGWGVRNGSEGSSSRPPLQRGGPSPRSKSKGLPEGQQGHRDDGDRRKQFEAEDFPSLHPDADREVSRDKAVATGVWEHPPNPQSRGSKMMVIKRVSREQPTPAQTCTSTPQQQQAPSRNGTGPSLYKGPIPISVSLPVKASRSSSSSPVDKGSQPRLMMRLTRMTRSDRKSTFLKALKKDMVDEEDLYHHCKHDDGFHPQNCNVGCGDENRNRCERSFSQENGNMTTLTMRQQVLRSSTFPQQEVLSSSLEAEHRLLKEMGWQEESDETCAPLTEDEMREFQAISEQLQKNGLRRNSFLKNGPPIDSLAVWKTSNLQMATDTTEETETSSSDTSDDDA
ncbi:vasculin isoform X1 [Oncorhynchus tshawytscha]|uniref:Vasculin n=2 Tax=Oncorhynchus tshawytscha TaxID=74940 RepID=A0AAZ3NS30_ONCTS|nr:vasculin isoform X1 [Oncorhynchus tshawytscha]XP_024237300.1 vasculin isoform X1 [Oncorhynchus tshawytscha]